MNMDEDMTAVAVKAIEKNGAEIMTSTKVVSVDNMGKKAVVTVEKDGVKESRSGKSACVHRQNTEYRQPQLGSGRHRM